jgi:hypothetical protein
MPLFIPKQAAISLTKCNKAVAFLAPVKEIVSFFIHLSAGSLIRVQTPVLGVSKSA